MKKFKLVIIKKYDIYAFMSFNKSLQIFLKN